MEFLTLKQKTRNFSWFITTLCVFFFCITPLTAQEGTVSLIVRDLEEIIPRHVQKIEISFRGPGANLNGDILQNNWNGDYKYFEKRVPGPILPERTKVQASITPVEIADDYLVLSEIQGLQSPKNIVTRFKSGRSRALDLLVERKNSNRLLVWVTPTRLSQLLANASLRTLPGSRTSQESRARAILDFLKKELPENAAWKHIRPTPSRAKFKGAARIQHLLIIFDLGNRETHRELYLGFRKTCQGWINQHHDFGNWNGISVKGAWLSKQLENLDVRYRV